MSLPVIIKFVYNHANEESIRRGKKIFYSAGVQLLDSDQVIEQIRFRVRNDQFQNYYAVTVNNFLSTEELTVTCQCPYNMGEVCRHKVAALFQLNDIIQSGFFDNAELSYNQQHTIVRMKQVSKQVLQIFSSVETIEHAERWAAEKRAVIKPIKHEKIEADIEDGSTTFHVIISQNEERYFDTSCGCSETHFPLCIHKATVFLQILKKHGADYFQSLQNWDIQKNKLLALYGYSLKDNLKGKFAFTYENGKPFLRVLDPTIKKVSQAATASSMAATTTTVATETPAPEAMPEKLAAELHLAILIKINENRLPFVTFNPATAYYDLADPTQLLRIEPIDTTQYINPQRYKDTERDILPMLKKVEHGEVVKYIQKNSPFTQVEGADAPPIDRQQALHEDQMWEYLLPKYHRLLQHYTGYAYTFVPADNPTGYAHLPFAEHTIHLQLEVMHTGNSYDVVLSWIIEHAPVAYSQTTVLSPALIKYNNKLYSLTTLHELKIVARFLKGNTLTISQDKWQKELETTLMPWSQKVHIHFAEDLVEHLPKVKPECTLVLQEKENTFLICPIFTYHGIAIKANHHGNMMQASNGKVKIVYRNEDAEREYHDLLRTLHTEISFSKKDGAYHLAGSAVLSNRWFFKFTDHTREWGMQLSGFDNLRNLKINTHKPETEVKVVSGIDWFDTTVELKFGSQSVSIIEVKRALTNKQNYVRLPDGSLGLLPTDWIDKYALLLKVGETRGNKIRIKKFHFTVLDELLSEIDEKALLEELEVKKLKLDSIIAEDFSHVRPPDYLEAVLRPYQLVGFQWLKFLNEAGWGGILADDMGLGKTLQTLAFFQHYKNVNPNPKYLVVCPTTLMFNWENEINKFTPTLTRAIHHGPKRTTNPDFFSQYDVIITTYGTMRSDVKLLREVVFDYIVLDESQSIKNPQSQVAKASLLLNCKNRLALSGTPLQNNTFDLYAQMHFLNPGMLGSREFFMSEFANPIDKFKESEVKTQLRKLTYPFLLRRTKEQVAKDLPEKTEMIIYCEMGKEQRKIYNAYRNTYRSQILGMIAEKGMERSHLHILQGLTKLRQICDSPAILNEEDKLPNHSIKLDELAREITENVGEHKVLIFSQFLGMLALIRGKLEETEVPYVYFDGSSTTTQREEAIQEFQNNANCRVFLISLKAGGIGLNLTAADYVYIVDPWWNPAVEQQAIDRTHRIGQTKNIFAYRLICKDTLEEKMLILQEEKRTLAKELISDDNAFMKKLTQEDIAYLFS